MFAPAIIFIGSIVIIILLFKIKALEAEPKPTEAKAKEFHRTWRDEKSYVLWYGDDIIDTFEHKEMEDAQSTIDAYAKTFGLDPIAIMDVPYRPRH